MQRKQTRKTPRIKPWAVGLELLFLSLVAGVAWVALQQLERGVRSDAGDALDAVLETSHESLSLWADQRQHDVVLLASDPILVGLAQEQLALDRDPATLLASESTENLREFFRQRPDRYGGGGFFLIAPDGTSIGSMRNQNLGTQNLVWRDRRALIERVFSGESVFVPPMKSDVPVPNHAGVLSREAPTLFFAAPVQDDAGHVIAALTIRHAPGRDFSRIAELARLGVTGETYAFDERGYLLTVSRFENELRQQGRLPDGKESILSLRVTEPKSGSQTLAVRRAINREHGHDIQGYLDYRGVPVLGAWTWSDRLGLGLTTEVDEEEALAPYRSARGMVFLVLGITVALALLLTALAVRIQRAGLRRVREREERLRAVLDTAVDGIITFDEEKRIESANSAAMAIFGIEIEELLGRSIGDLIKEPDGESLSVPCRELDPTGDSVCRCEYLARRKDGTSFEIEVGIGESLREGEKLFTAVFRDISTRRQMESQLLQSQKLEAVGQLAAGVAHDFNNLLMGIGGCADVAIGRLDDKHDARELMEHVRSSARSGSAISQQLVALARKDDSRPLEQAALDEIIVSTEPMLARLLGEDVRLVVTPNAGLAIPKCAGGQIEQIIINLTVNARDAMRNGGEIEMSSWQETFEGESSAPQGLSAGRYVAVSVADTGSGIDKATRERIFDPFFTTKALGKGTGLGLSTVYSIVRDNGGTILLESEEGEGSTFTVYLPWREDATSSQQRESDFERHTGTVLLVEDDQLVRMTVHGYLQDAGFRVLEAKDGDEALHLAGYETIDMLVSDIVLPGHNGAEIASALPSVPVVLMSAHPAEYLSETGRIEPGTPILQKPFTRAQLLEALPHTRPEPELINLIEVAPGNEVDIENCRVLLVEDNPAARLATSELLRDAGIDVVSAASGREALTVYRETEESVDVLVADIGLPDMPIGKLLGALNLIRPIRRTVFVSGRSADDPCVLDLLGNKGTLFVPKPVDVDELARVIRSASA
jgi:PAS domain S-box-containing protein